MWLVKASAVGNSSHTLAYSLVGLQEMNLAYKYPTIYWDCAVLIADSGSLEDSDKSTKYGKVATALATLQKNGIKIEPPLINSAERQFVPDVDRNSIIYSLKALNKIGDDVVDLIVKNRPFVDMQDFYETMIDTKLIKTGQMITLIKAGAFADLMCDDVVIVMNSFLNHLFTHKEKLTMANFSMIEKYGIIPQELKLIQRIYNFKNYVFFEDFLYKVVIDTKKKIPKCGYHDRLFKLDDVSMPFFQDNFSEDSVEMVDGEYFVISEKKFEKEWKKKIEPLKEWVGSKQAVDLFNLHDFEQLRQKYALGTIEHWQMESLSCYLGKHELSGVNNNKYGIVNYFELPEIPFVEDYYYIWIKEDGIRKRKAIPKKVIYRLAGAVLDKDKYKATLSLLTIYGVVQVKFNKGQFAFYNKQISKINNDGTKTVLEKSWFQRGSLVLICGYREGDIFKAYRYNNTIYQHTCNKIVNVRKDGSLQLQLERMKVGVEEDGTED